ncbi:endonuclease/exonuclease/phosphatase family protein [Stigmatella hybrida]|uniref:endonuclease/exonuclease/phosphatase family protein n=1 Tax=Stigmatella hybrida TaxID=394097 RepID=UPI001CDAB85C|nr:endonuclease/exonuclease/phosphatase family protein [Stigmatella hybrida]
MLAAALMLCAAVPAHARCVDGTVVECTASNGCPGESICDGIKFGKCVASDCHAPTVSVTIQTSGLGSGREVTAGPSSWGYQPGNDPQPAYLFPKAQRPVVFTATGVSSGSVRFVKLSGELKTLCAARRVNQHDSEHRHETIVPLSSENTASHSQSSLSTSLQVNFLSFPEFNCPTGFLPWKQEVSLYAETTTSYGNKAYSYRKSFISVQTFKVATYNVQNGKLALGGDTIDALAAHMNENDVDVAALQEADHTTVTRLRQSPNIGLLRTAVYEAPVTMQAGGANAIFSKFPVYRHQSIQHSRPIPGMDHRWHYVTLDLGGFHVKLANVHFISNSVAENRGIYAPDHRRTNVQDVVNHMSALGTPAIIAGDFNTPVFQEDSGYQIFNSQLDSITSSPIYRHFCLTNSCEGSLNPESRYNIDQIWATIVTPAGLKVVDGYLARRPSGDEPSDHTMQVSRLKLEEPLYSE